MNELQALDQLDDHLPSRRAEAAAWLSLNASAAARTRITAAVTTEPVPSIRALLESAMRSLRAPSQPIPDPAEERQSFGSDARDLSSHLSSMIRHETDPAIGWLRRAAAREIESFESSQTNRYIETLRRRIVALSRLAAAYRRPVLERISIDDIISRSALDASDLGPGLFNISVPRRYITTDWALLELIIVNGLRNAAEAASAAPSPQGWPVPVRVEAGAGLQNFWITITNRFAGQSFDEVTVSHAGTSSKPDHKGLGVTAMRVAADRLGYDFSLQGAGGTATMVLRGPINDSGEQSSK